jgi:predicted helicase
MPTKPTPSPYAKLIKKFYADQQKILDQDKANELNIRQAFQTLLAESGQLHDWTLVAEVSLTTPSGKIRPDGILYDQFKLPRGHWESKDIKDDLDREIEKKIKSGYPLKNIIFENSQRAVLYQNGTRVLEVSLSDALQVTLLFGQFFSHIDPIFEGFNQAVNEFKGRVRELGEGLAKHIGLAHQENKKFKTAYASFEDLCRKSLNPEITRPQVDEMLIQHLLTDRIMRKVIDNVDFLQKNIIAREIETVITALTSASFSRQEYFKALDPFYLAIERTAQTLTDFTEKQTFLNEIYEIFFQGYSVKVADTHGIVYTPQPIVNFMCQSVEEVLQQEFNLQLGDPNLIILDPCTGTGNFIVNLINRVSIGRLEQFYRESLFANEIMLLPYYVAALNIEYAYYQRAGRYDSFEGLCFVDTLDLKHGIQPQLTGISEENYQRVIRQGKAPITVIIGNPPYNMGQQNENDNNPNRRYLEANGIDTRIRETYVANSNATLRNKLYDPYVRFFRWATDRLAGKPGIVCMVSNNGFLTGTAFDGFRQQLSKDFDLIYHFDFKGNARMSGERRRQEGGNIFNDMIRVGVGITILVNTGKQQPLRLFYHEVKDYWTSATKTEYLTQHDSISKLKWQRLTPDGRHSWMVPKNVKQFDKMLPMGLKDSKAKKAGAAPTLFETYSLGVVTARDTHVYNFSTRKLTEQVKVFVDIYNIAALKLGADDELTPESLIVTTDPRIKWSRQVKGYLKKHKRSQKFQSSYVRQGLYRPFTKKYLYFDDFWIEERYLQPQLFPTSAAEKENRAICVPNVGSTKPFHVLMINVICDYHAVVDTQCFPFYTYDKDGPNRKENITDWALQAFQTHYGDPSITKWDIFYYVYAALHDPAYREKYADNLKQDLPKIPYHTEFREWSARGKRLGELHIGYEQLQGYPLVRATKEGATLKGLYRVEKMVISKDRTAIQVNKHLTLKGIPSAAWDYKLGNKSALEWVVDQYQVKDESDPNREEDPEYIVRLIEQVVQVSVETLEIIKGIDEAE